MLKEKPRLSRYRALSTSNAKVGRPLLLNRSRAHLAAFVPFLAALSMTTLAAGLQNSGKQLVPHLTSHSSLMQVILLVTTKATLVNVCARVCL